MSEIDRIKEIFNGHLKPQADYCIDEIAREIAQLFPKGDENGLLKAGDIKKLGWDWMLNYDYELKDVLEAQQALTLRLEAEKRFNCEDCPYSLCRDYNLQQKEKEQEKAVKEAVEAERERIKQYILGKYLNDGLGISKSYSKTATYKVAKDLLLDLALAIPQERGVNA